MSAIDILRLSTVTPSCLPTASAASLTVTEPKSLPFSPALALSFTVLPSSFAFALFALSIIVCSILEYFTSYIMEKLFKVRWWDYSDKKFNINGRICLETMVPFGILGTLIVCYINPFLNNLLMQWLCYKLVLLYSIYIIYRRLNYFFKSCYKY